MTQHRNTAAHHDQTRTVTSQQVTVIDGKMFGEGRRMGFADGEWPIWIRMIDESELHLKSEYLFMRRDALTNDDGAFIGFHYEGYKIYDTRRDAEMCETPFEMNVYHYDAWYEDSRDSFKNA